jgi:hypothetical protein
MEVYNYPFESCKINIEIIAGELGHASALI